MISIIGAGKMGEALARGILQAGLLPPASLVLSDPLSDRVAGLAAELGAVIAPDNRTAVRDAEVVILAVKPPVVPVVCGDITPVLRPGTIVLSIAAGVPLAALQDALGREDLLPVRAMPNTPCLVRAGAIAVSYTARAGAAARTTVGQLLAPLGLVEEVPETLLDAITGLSGSGPAYIAVLMEALADGGVHVGLPRALAQRFAAQTVYGTARLLLETGMHPAEIKDAVTSPGGTTIAGLAALEDHRFRHALMEAVIAATARARAAGKG